MDSAAEKLMMENMNKNAIDYEEYPATVDLQNRCGEQSKEWRHQASQKPSVDEPLW
jgi:glutamate/tyrosine decarboxylase-like PLP-dependent enzyme